MPQELDQAQRRRYVILEDDFSPPRRWESTIDIIAQSTCAPINPKGWNDPLNTPQVVLMHALVTNTDTGRLSLGLKQAYAEWRDNLKQKSAEYEQRLYGDAMMLFGQQGPEAYEKRAPALLNYTGPAPQAWEPIEAALQGNSYALGRTTKDDPRVSKYFPKVAEPTLDFTDATFENELDLEEQADPDATGGKKVPVQRKKKELIET